MNTHDKALSSAVYAAVERANNNERSIEDSADEILALIEADRKRRGEPVYLLAETDGMWSETNEATFLWWKANSPRAARVLYTAPQHAEPVKVPSDEDIEGFLAERMTPEGRVPMIQTIREALARYGQPTT